MIFGEYMRFKYLMINLIFYNIFSMDISNKLEISSDIIFMQLKETDQDWFKQFGKLWKTEEFNFWISPYRDPIANGITKFEVSNEDELIKNIDLIISCAKKNHVPFSWSVEKNKFSQEITQLLENKGFSREETDVMINCLDDIDKIKIPELCIKRIKESEIEQWLNIFNTAFDGEYDVNFTKAYFQLIQKNLVIENSKAEYYAAYVDSKIVSIGTIFYIPNMGL